MADNYFDPTEDTPPAGAQDTSSADASKSGVRKAWDAWTSKPENNAALLQFGIAMMQPRAQGQSSLGQFGNAIGEAGEASSRNVASQESQQDRETKRAEQLSTAEYRRAQGEAATKNADSYGRQVDQSPGGSGLAAKSLSNQFRVQADFRRWLAKSEDTMGLTADPLLEAVKKKFPGVQRKADLVENPAAQKYAMGLFNQQFTTEAPDDTGTDPATTAPASPTPGPTGGQPQIKTFYDKTTGAPRQFQWNGTTWTPIQ